MTISKTDSKPYGTEFFLSTPDSGEESIVNWNSLGRIIDFNLNITTPTPNTIFENEKRYSNNNTRQRLCKLLV